MQPAWPAYTHRSVYRRIPVYEERSARMSAVLGISKTGTRVSKTVNNYHDTISASSQFCLSGASFSPAVRFSCAWQAIRPLSAKPQSGMYTFSQWPWGRNSEWPGLGPLYSWVGLSIRCWPDSVARRTGLAPRQSGWDTELPGYHSYFPDWLQPGFRSVTTSSALSRVPGPSVTWAHSPVEATNTQQTMTVRSAERGSRGRLRALSERRRRPWAHLSPSRILLGEWQQPENADSHRTVGGNEAVREEGRAFQVDTCAKAWVQPGARKFKGCRKARALRRSCGDGDGGGVGKGGTALKRSLLALAPLRPRNWTPTFAFKTKLYSCPVFESGGSGLQLVAASSGTPQAQVPLC